jgi:hypothetical protein
MAKTKHTPKQPTREKRDKKIKQHQDFNNVGFSYKNIASSWRFCQISVTCSFKL